MAQEFTGVVCEQDWGRIVVLKGFTEGSKAHTLNNYQNKTIRFEVDQLFSGSKQFRITKGRLSLTMLT